jgi:GT2 family glycosyltransferase
VRRIGLFDEELVRNQDDEYNLRLLSQGGRILQVPEIRSRYFSRASLQSLWKQYFQYGYWKVRVMQKHPRRMRLRHFIPSAFVTVLGGLGALALWSAPARLLLGAVLIAYFVTALAASLVTANREDWRYLPLLPVIYLILHLSYGLGFLYGLVRFVRRWGDRRGQVPALQEQRIRVSRFPSSSD